MPAGVGGVLGGVDLRSIPLEERRASKRLIDMGQAVLRFDAFVRMFWEVIEPGRPLIWNWHLDIICNAIQKQVDGDPAYRRLLILIPPGYMKSVLVSVMRPAWIWLRHPTRRSIYFSHGEKLAARDSRRTRDVIQSAGYREILATFAPAMGWADGQPWELKDDQNQKVNFENTLTGSRQCFGMYSDWTGARGDDMVVDDPVDAGEVISGSPDQVNTRMSECMDIINNKMQSRVNDKRTATWTLVMQRLHDNDPAGNAIKDGDWYVVCIPQEFEPDHPYRHPNDPRTEPGELINKGFDDPGEIAREKRNMAARHWLAQRQQRPSNDTTGILPRRVIDALPRWTDVDAEAGACTEIGMSVDCTFGNTDGADKVAIHVWGRRGWGRRSLLGRTTRRMSYTEMKGILVAMARQWGPSFVLVEKKANGAAVLDDLADAIPALVPFEPGRESKTTRAELHLAPLTLAGQIVLPDRQLNPWVAEVEDSWVNLRPGGDNDDDADAAVQINKYWTDRSKQSEWLDESVSPDVLANNAVYTTISGSGALYVHNASVLIAPPMRMICAVAPPTGRQVPGCAVVITDQGDVIGHVEATGEGYEGFARAVTMLCKEAAMRYVVQNPTRKPLTMAQQVQLRIILTLGKDAAAADAMAEAFRSRGFTPQVEDAAPYDSPRAWWNPTSGTLAVAAAKTREIAEYGRLRIHDPKILALVRRATLDPETAVPDVPLTRDVAARMLPRPTAMDALLLALLGATDAYADSRDMATRATLREEERANPTSAQKVYELHVRRTYGVNGKVTLNNSSGSTDVWAATTASSGGFRQN